MRSVEVEGATIDEAIEKALDVLREDRDRVDVEILDHSARGLLGFGGRTARVRATVRASAFTVVSRETSSTVGIDAARLTLEEVLRHLGSRLELEVGGPVDGCWPFLVKGSDAGIAIGRHGQTLDAIEYLLNRIAAQRSGAPERIELDVEGYRQRRRESLEATARRAASKVKETGMPAALNPMNPRERRIVHLVLNEDRDVSTRSEGEGSFRRVMIVPRSRDRA